MVTLLPITSLEKTHIMKLACGDHVQIPEGWFDSLRILENLGNAQVNTEDSRKTGSSAAARTEHNDDENFQEESSTLDGDHELTNEDNCQENISEGHNDYTEETISEFKKNMKNIMMRATNDKTVLDGLITFNVALKKRVYTNAALASAFHTFGKYHGKHSSSRILVQPTAIARRKSRYRGRQLLTSSRPPKSSFVPEHAYCKKKKSRALVQHRQHRLAECVRRDILPATK